MDNHKENDDGVLLSLPHITVLRYYLHTVGDWPRIGKKRDVKNPRYRYTWHCRVMQCVMSTIATGMIYHMFKYFRELDFLSVADAYLAICITILTVAKTFLPTGKLYSALVEDSFVNFNLYQYKNDGIYQSYICSRVQRVSHLFTYYLAVMTVIGSSFFNIPAIIGNLKEGSYLYNRSPNSTLYFSFFFEYPGFRMHDHFYIATLITFIGCNTAAVTVCMLDCLMFLTMFQLIGHIFILLHKIQRLGQGYEGRCSNTIRMYNTEENKLIYANLKDAIIYHQLICRFAKDISNVFKVGTTCSYLYYLSGSCVLLFLCSGLDPDVLSRFLPVTFITFGNLIQTSVIYELVTIVSDRLPATVYNVPWELMDKRNRQTLMIFLHRVQTPVRIEALGSLKIGLESMAAILKTTFSYYLFLKTVSDD